MTLLIACLLIYHMDLSGWWYGIAGVIWLAQFNVGARLLNHSQELIVAGIRNGAAVRKKLDE